MTAARVMQHKWSPCAHCYLRSKNYSFAKSSGCLLWVIKVLFSQMVNIFPNRQVPVAMVLAVPNDTICWCNRISAHRVGILFSCIPSTASWWGRHLVVLTSCSCGRLTWVYLSVLTFSGDRSRLLCSGRILGSLNFMILANHKSFTCIFFLNWFCICVVFHCNSVQMWLLTLTLSTSCPARWNHCSPSASNSIADNDGSRSSCGPCMKFLPEYKDQVTEHAIKSGDKW